MKKDNYVKMLIVLNKAYDSNEKIIIAWSCGFTIKCVSFTGSFETSMEPEDEGYIGEFAAGINEIEILEEGNDDVVKTSICDNSMELSLLNIPEKIMSEDGIVLWKKQ